MADERLLLWQQPAITNSNGPTTTNQLTVHNLKRQQLRPV
jgi:hypothetical protein